MGMFYIFDIPIFEPKDLPKIIESEFAKIPSSLKEKEMYQILKLIEPKKIEVYLERNLKLGLDLENLNLDYVEYRKDPDLPFIDHFHFQFSIIEWYKRKYRNSVKDFFEEGFYLFGVKCELKENITLREFLNLLKEFLLDFLDGYKYYKKEERENPVYGIYVGVYKLVEGFVKEIIKSVQNSK